jgi:hypothetical protein
MKKIGHISDSTEPVLDGNSMISQLGWDTHLQILRENNSNQQPKSKISFGQAIDFTIKFYPTSKTAD